MSRFERLPDPAVGGRCVTMHLSTSAITVKGAYDKVFKDLFLLIKRGLVSSIPVSAWWRDKTGAARHSALPHHKPQSCQRMNGWRLLCHCHVFFSQNMRA
jgi:hypothetical protein|mmetsp:Transcript_2534/g.4711  ORF Transcript_2534/g.4711 Transcript_2534/m.4711 type:complete len:100 (+) Transcript_2534:845-1144(+)